MLFLPLGNSQSRQLKQVTQFDKVVKQHGIMGVVVRQHDFGLHAQVFIFIHSLSHSLTYHLTFHWKLRRLATKQRTQTPLGLNIVGDIWDNVSTQPKNIF